jgi:hypothetical protein
MLELVTVRPGFRPAPSLAPPRFFDCFIVDSFELIHGASQPLGKVWRCVFFQHFLNCLQECHFMFHFPKLDVSQFPLRPPPYQVRQRIFRYETSATAFLISIRPMRLRRF